LKSDVHNLIHCTQPDTINKYLQKVILDSKGLKKVNSLRLLAGNLEIKVQKSAKILVGTPYAVKVARTVWRRGKA